MRNLLSGILPKCSFAKTPADVTVGYLLFPSNSHILFYGSAYMKSLVVPGLRCSTNRVLPTCVPNPLKSFHP